MTSPEPQPWVVDEDSRRLLEAAETAFEEAVAASDAVRAALTARRRPHDTDLRLVSDAASAFDRLRAALPKDADLPPSATLADIRAVLDELASARRDAALVRRLTAVTGPPQVEDVLAEVRAAAADGELRELSVLTLLIEAAGADDVDVDEVDALSEKAHEELPDHWSKVISFAARGRLSLSPVPASTADDATAEPAASAPPTQDAAKTSDSSEQGPSLRPVSAEPTPDAAATFVPPAEAEPTPTSSADANDADETVIPVGGATARDIASAETDDLEPLLIADARHREAASARESGGADDDARTVPERQPQPAPEPAVHKTVDGSGAESADDDADRGRQAEAAALQSERLALAGWVRLACGAPEAQARARWAAALAREINASGGRLWPAYIEMVRGLDADALGDDTAGRLLVWASAIRAGIIRPSDESTEMLRQHAPVVAAHQGLAELGEKFLNAAAVGTHLVPGVSNKLSGAQPEEWRQEMVERARTMLADGPRKTIKYSTATEVWKHLLQEDREIGRLLASAAADAESRAREAGDQVERLRAAGAIDRLIDKTTRELRRHRSRRRIEAAARRRLIQLIEEALDIVHGWSRAVREVLDVRGAK
ncbi:MAG: hypothetical protein IRY90_02105, partial [Actinomadura rubrobrunea]|nr:hypothetical protein [Actinomadura rubrobrunea]